ncbi:MAG: D-tyrosyl-tRNA(Tyr) deacylase [Planctomycetaceae bacterium]|nr:D-tyrosyl-tRNA(Tyr) deacylase [Planctomycetaceae bacterium]
MRAVIQRVGRASVCVEGTLTGRIETGLLVFLGVGRDDTQKDIDFLADKIANLRVFEDAGGKMNLSVHDINGGILLISQFTLYADCRKGCRPDFTAAAPPDMAQALYEKTIEALKQKGLAVQTGVFAAHMDIDALNDGPVTVLLDSRQTLV